MYPRSFAANRLQSVIWNWRHHRLKSVPLYMKKISKATSGSSPAKKAGCLKRGADLRIALCYPNVYAIGMANLGFQAMYEIFNNIPEVSCERVFLPDSGRSARLSKGSEG